MLSRLTWRCHAQAQCRALAGGRHLAGARGADALYARVRVGRGAEGGGGGGLRVPAVHAVILLLVLHLRHL